MFFCALGLELIQRTLAFFCFFIIFHGAHKFIVHLCKKIINFMAQRAIITSAFQFELLALCQPEKSNNNHFISSIQRKRERQSECTSKKEIERERERPTQTAILQHTLRNAIISKMCQQQSNRFQGHPHSLTAVALTHTHSHTYSHTLAHTLIRRIYKNRRC